MAHIQIILPDESQFSHELAGDKTTVGRTADNLLCIKDDSVSSHHAEIVFDGSTHRLRDLGSTNGTFVNGEHVSDAVLSHGDELRFGGVAAVFLSEESPERTDHPQPPPSQTAAAAQAAEKSARPENFVSSSPIPRNVVKRDLVGLLVLGLGGVALAAAIVVAAFAFFMQG